MRINPFSLGRGEVKPNKNFVWGASPLCGSRPTNCRLAIMRTVSLILLIVAVCGCSRALIYTGSVKAGDNQKAIAIAKIIEEEFSKKGLKNHSDFYTPGGTYYEEWVMPVGSERRISLWVGDWVKDGALYLRIVPQPYCNGVSQKLGEHMRGFMEKEFSDFEWTMTMKPEFDWFR